jgi:hypothetical protein
MEPVEPSREMFFMRFSVLVKSDGQPGIPNA